MLYRDRQRRAQLKKEIMLLMTRCGVVCHNVYSCGELLINLII